MVTQPPAAKGRGKKLSPSLVAELAMERNFPTSKIFWPERAGEVCGYLPSENVFIFVSVSYNLVDVFYFTEDNDKWWLKFHQF